MNPELTNKAAYDLALEYTRQNNLLKRSTEVTLEQQIENFKKIHNEILKCLNNYNSLIGVFPNFLTIELKIIAD